MNNYDDNTSNAPNANDFLGGNYLGKEDLDKPVRVTVENVWAEAVPNSGRRKLVVQFQEFEKPMILNKTNIKRLARIFNTGDTTQWRGQVVLYVDESIEYAGRLVGGIRLRPANAQSEVRGDMRGNVVYSNGESREVHEASKADFEGF